MQVGWVRAPSEAERNGRLSGDPLGLRVFVQYLGGRITPGLGRGQANIWGLGLLCAGVELAGQGLRCESWFVRWQRLALFASLYSAQTHQRVDDEGQARPVWKVGGIRKARRLLSSTSASAPLDETLKANELGGGLWGGYARAGRMYGLVATQGTVRLADHRTTEQGRILAETTFEATGADQDQLEAVIRQKHPVDLADLGPAIGLPPDRYLDMLEDVLRAGDARWGGRLAWLWPYLPGLEVADPNELPADAVPVNASQAAALQAARPVAELLRIVEGAFRAEDATELSSDLADHEAFIEADRAGYAPEYDPVREALVPGGAEALDRLWTLHRDRHPTTGAWDRSEGRPLYDEARPDFGLDAPFALYLWGLWL